MEKFKLTMTIAILGLLTAACIGCGSSWTVTGNSIDVHVVSEDTIMCVKAGSTIIQSENDKGN